jgi:hypothetical protein
MMIVIEFLRKMYVRKELKGWDASKWTGEIKANLRMRFPGSLTKWNKILSVKDTNIKTRPSGYGDHDVSMGFECHLRYGYFVRHSLRTASKNL